MLIGARYFAGRRQSNKSARPRRGYPTACPGWRRRADEVQEGGIIHAAMAAPASTPSADTSVPIISLAVWLRTGWVSSSAAGGGSTMVRHDSAATAWRGE